MMVDEAHKLTPELLEEIRLLTNFETSEHKLIQILLAGQTELNALLNREDLRQLKQRIDIRLTISLCQARTRNPICSIAGSGPAARSESRFPRRRSPQSCPLPAGFRDW